MSAHPPPVPPANRSTKGPGDPTAPTGGGDPTAPTGGKGHEIHPGKAPNNTGEQGQQGNTKQNTTHPGTVGDR